MGACLGQCFANVNNPFTFRRTNTHSEEGELVELCGLADGEDNCIETGTSRSLLSILSLKRFKKKRNGPVGLNLMEESGWSRNFNTYSRLKSKIDSSRSSGLNSPPQTLDPRTLLRQQGCISSTPASSLDLEWEHEVLPSSSCGAYINPEVGSSNGSLSKSCTSINESQPSSLTASQWSKVSTPNSLEWDPVEAELGSVDIETEQLLTEIERLTDRTLKETGEWTGSS